MISPLPRPRCCNSSPAGKIHAGSSRTPRTSCAASAWPSRAAATGMARLRNPEHPTPELV
eukprot:10852272-Alexandrium_andersonii.AAC.1